MVAGHDKPFRGFFFEKYTQGGSMLTGNQIQETPYKFKASVIPKQVIFGHEPKKKNK